MYRAVSCSSGRDRLVRLLRMVNLLQSGSRCAVSQLMADCRVSRRTVFRDLRLLQSAGIPVRYQSGSSSYVIQVERSSQLPQMDAEELAVTLWALHAAPIAPGGVLRGVAARAARKLLQALAPEVRPRAANASRVVAVPKRRLAVSVAEERHFLDVLWALHSRTRLLVACTDQESNSPLCTRLAPYRLIHERRGWVVLGDSSWHQKTHKFRLDHFLAVERTSEPFELPHSPFKEPSPIGSTEGKPPRLSAAGKLPP